MLYAYFGNNIVKVRDEANVFLRKQDKRGAQIARITPGEYISGSLEDAAESVSLFGEDQVVVLDTPSSNPEMFEKVFDLLESFSESQTIFVLIEAKLLAPEKKKLEKYASLCFESNLKTMETFNGFALSDALASRDKKKLWILLIEAKKAGQSAEEIIGILFWQLKSLRLAARTGNADEAGVKPFVYTKAKRALSKFKDGELDVLSETLAMLYHDGHSGKRDIDVALERWVLAL